MAGTSGFYLGGSDRRIQWTITGLENPASQYDRFRISTSDGKSKTWSDGTDFDYTTNHGCGMNVTGFGYATWQGIEYAAGSAVVTLPNCVDTTPPTLTLTWTRYPNQIEVNHSCINQDGDFSQVQLRVNGSLTYSVFVTQYTYMVTGLNSNTTYEFSWTVWDVHNNSRNYTYYISTTTGPPPNAPTNFSYTVVNPTTRVYNVTWTASPGATSYEINAILNGTRAIKYQGSSTNAQITLDNPGSGYRIEIFAFNSNGVSQPLVGFITTAGETPPGGGYPPGTPPPGTGGLESVGPLNIFRYFITGPDEVELYYGIGFNGLGVDWYRILARKAGTSQWYQLYHGGHTGSLGPYLFDSGNTDYEVVVYACTSDSAASCGLPSYGYFKTAAAPDTRGPTIMETYQSHGDSIDANWSISDITNDSATDTESGFAHAILYMSGMNASSPRNAMFTTYSAQSSMTLAVDGTGAAIQPQKTYTFHWEAWDNAGNKTTNPAIDVTTTVARPPNFNWIPAINAGQNFNMTANQWDFFQKQINAFRGYVGNLGPYTFTPVTAGFTMNADHYNEARNAIFGMNGNIPPFRNPGETIFASDLNALTTALNAVP